MELILQQDDCAPDSYESFMKQFEQLMGKSFDDWKSQDAIRHSNDSSISFESTDHFVDIHADDPYFKLYKK